MLKRILKDRRGEMYIDMCLSIMILLTVLAIGLYLMAYTVTRQTADTICTNLLEVATTTGEFGAEFEAADEYLREAYFDYTVTVDGNYYESSTTRVQLGNVMCVQVTYTTYLLAWSGHWLPITISVTKYGLSQNYWK